MSENFPQQDDLFDAKIKDDSVGSDQFDANIKKVFADVPVPAGLESRILAALAAAPPSDKTPSDKTLPADKPIPSDARPQSRPKPRRRYRHLYLGASAVFVAASLLVALLLQLTAAPPLSESSIIQVAMDDFDSPASGIPLPKQWPAAVKEFQPSRDLNLSQCKSIRWQKLNNFLETKGVVYSFTTPNNAQARLYVLAAPQKIAHLPAIPPRNPSGDTGGLLAYVWQTDGRLYILVVHGNRRTYRGLLVPAGPLT